MRHDRPRKPDHVCPQCGSPAPQRYYCAPCRRRLSNDASRRKAAERWERLGLTGREFGHLTVLGPWGPYVGIKYAACRCSQCGHEGKVKVSELSWRTACASCQPRPCPGCGTSDPESFARSRNRPGGRQLYCHRCLNAFKSQSHRPPVSYHRPQGDSLAEWNSFLKHLGLAIDRAAHSQQLSEHYDHVFYGKDGNPAGANIMLSDNGFAALEIEVNAGCFGDFPGLRETQEKYA